jgi:hypothetical protein
MLGFRLSALTPNKHPLHWTSLSPGIQREGSSPRASHRAGHSLLAGDSGKTGSSRPAVRLPGSVTPIHRGVMTRYRALTTHEHSYNQLKVDARVFFDALRAVHLGRCTRRPFLNKGSKTVFTRFARCGACRRPRREPGRRFRSAPQGLGPTVRGSIQDVRGSRAATCWSRGSLSVLEPW